MKILYSILLLIFLTGLPTGHALAHDGEPHGGGLWNLWNIAPGLLVGLLAAGFLYVNGVRNLWRRSTGGSGVSQWQVTCFFAGLLALAAALISPLDSLAGVSLAWHMIQHLLLVVVAAPLLVLGNPILGFLWAFPGPVLQRGGRLWNRQPGLKRVLRFLAYPLVVWSIHATVITVWHVPGLYQAALRATWIHDLEHLSFLLAALLFWWLVLPRRGAEHYPGHGLAVFMLFTTMLQGGLLGALLTFSKTLWYPVYQESSLLVMSSALDDQTLAGTLMWIPPGLVYSGVALSILAKLLNSGEERHEASRLEATRES